MTRTNSACQFVAIIVGFYLVFIKLGEYVGVHNISTKFYNQPNPPQSFLNYGPWIVQNWGLRSLSQSFYLVFIKLGEYVRGHNISTKFYNLPNPARHSWIMALELSKMMVSALSQFIQSLSNLVNMLVGIFPFISLIISWPSSITCQISPGTPELWPLHCPKTELAVSALQVEYPAPKNVFITIEFTTNTTGVICISLALVLVYATESVIPIL